MTLNRNALTHTSLLPRSILLAALSISCAAHAGDSSPMVQVGITDAHGHADHDFIGLTKTESDLNSRGYLVAYSRYFTNTGNQLQFSLARRNVDFEDINSRGHFWGADIDWKITLTKTLIKPYVVAGMGYQEFNSSDSLKFADDDLSGLSFNAGIGVIADVSQHWRIDLGYQRKSVWSTDNLAIFADSETRMNEISLTLGRHL